MAHSTSLSNRPFDSVSKPQFSVTEKTAKRQRQVLKKRLRISTEIPGNSTFCKFASMSSRNIQKRKKSNILRGRSLLKNPIEQSSPVNLGQVRDSDEDDGEPGLLKENNLPLPVENIKKEKEAVVDPPGRISTVETEPGPSKKRKMAITAPTGNRKKKKRSLPRAKLPKEKVYTVAFVRHW